MKIIFMGTPEFAVPSLLQLIKDGHETAAIITQPDKPKGRGHILTPPPVKAAAVLQGIPVYQPVSLKDNALLPLLEKIKPDAVVVVAYGKILPEYILSFPAFGCINVHASLLPKYRGAAPIQRAIMDGERVTGITTMKMAAGLDTGDMLLSETLEIDPHETAGQLSQRLSELGASLISKTLNELSAITPTPQDHSKATYAPMIEKSDTKLSFNKGARDIINHIRGLSPSPGAFSLLEGKPYKFFSAHPFDGQATSSLPGTILFADKQNGLVLASADKPIAITELLAPGTRRMSSKAFLLGHPLETGKQFL